MKYYYQCRMRNGTEETMGWIEARGAKVGRRVELLPDREYWTVLSVSQPPMAENMLKEHQLMHRGSLPSVDPIGR